MCGFKRLIFQLLMAIGSVSSVREILLFRPESISDMFWVTSLATKIVLQSFPVYPPFPYSSGSYSSGTIGFTTTYTAPTVDFEPITYSSEFRGFDTLTLQATDPNDKPHPRPTK